jgi:hypothetical protein
LERQAFVADKKAIIFDMMIDIAEEEYKLTYENAPPEQSTILNTKKANNNAVICSGRQTVYYRRIKRKIIRKLKL